jgi:hypothetical protein
MVKRVIRRKETAKWAIKMEFRTDSSSLESVGLTSFCDSNEK